ncbi:hypothetical protein AMECASPLE_033471 [Ameca splendens]|uniref:Uncharacterized protein n=1 Tax=Ameca splendens TaxID=208324 RepID=A0ABV1ADA0_9TELE
MIIIEIKTKNNPNRVGGEGIGRRGRIKTKNRNKVQAGDPVAVLCGHRVQAGDLVVVPCGHRVQAGARTCNVETWVAEAEPVGPSEARAGTGPRKGPFCLHS